MGFHSELGGSGIQGLVSASYDHKLYANHNNSTISVAHTIVNNCDPRVTGFTSRQHGIQYHRGSKYWESSLYCMVINILESLESSNNR